MKLAFTLVISVLLFSGCSVFKSGESAITEPVLLKQSPLPSLPESLLNKDLNLYCEMLIDKDGKVERAKLVTGSGDKAWDYLAETSLLKWEFSPALLDNDPVEILVRRKIVLQYVEPQAIALAEILCERKSVADSMYSMLVAGSNFNKLAKEYSVSPTRDQGGYLGKVDIRYYCKEIRQILSNLSEDEFTKPVVYGEHYVIFKRIKDNNGNVNVNFLH